MPFNSMVNIKSAEFVKSSSQLSECPPEKMPEYAFIGRSNVGKSSLINMLTGRKKLAKTSGTPGKTQLINHFLINDKWYLVDLPGYGWAQVSKTDKRKWKLMINEYLEMRRTLSNVFVLVDVRHDPQKIDLDFMNDLGIKQIPFSIVFTKSDKLGKTVAQKNMANYRKVLSKQWEELPPIIQTSSQSGMGKAEVLDYINRINQSIEF